VKIATKYLETFGIYAALLIPNINRIKSRTFEIGGGRLENFRKINLRALNNVFHISRRSQNICPFVVSLEV